MPQFLDCVVANDPVIPSSGYTNNGYATILIDPTTIASIRESTDVADILKSVQWHPDAAKEQAEVTTSLVGITLSTGGTVWASHDLDDILKGMLYLRENPEVLVVQVDDLPTVGRKAA